MDVITTRAYAKINLGLDVLRRRDDGYHEVKMIMQTIGLHDILTFNRVKEKKITLFLDKADLPSGKDNLIYRAAELVMVQHGIKEGINIVLEKNIPIAAGMAGGSTDAAAVFRGLNQLFSLSMTDEEMRQMGVKIGADVPYCIMGGTALAEGIGEILTRLPAPPPVFITIAKPDISVSTKYVYENLHAETLTLHPDIDGMAKALSEYNLEGITDRMGNVLESVTIKKYPVIQEIKDAMNLMGAENSLMSGSGPTVFGLFRQKDKAERAGEEIRERGLAHQIFVTEFVNP